MKTSNLLASQTHLTTQKLVAPIIKWSGSKRHVAKFLSTRFPDYGCYIEPFIGGGSMLPYRRSEMSVAGDIISPLIDVWKLIQTDVEHLIEGYRVRWQAFQLQRDEYYYGVRDRFNQEGDPVDFLFLTRTAYNGLIRFNSKGLYNAPPDSVRPGVHPDRFAVVARQWHQTVQGVEFLVSDYRETLDRADSNSFVFLDPPYFRTKAQYQSGDFDYEALCDELDRLNRIGAKWMMMLDEDAVQRRIIPSELYKHSFITPPSSSSFRRRKRIRQYVSDTVFTNYLPDGDMN